jgi:nucleoid-associated protein YgaU
MFIGLAISIVAVGLLLTKEDLGMGRAEPELTPEKFDTDSGRPREDTGSAVSYAPPAQPVQIAPLKPAAPPPAETNVTAVSHDENAAIPAPARATRFYIVKSGDSLEAIAKKYYGTAAAVDKIYRANKGTIESPSKLKPGMKIVLPD